VACYVSDPCGKLGNQTLFYQLATATDLQVCLTEDEGHIVAKKQEKGLCSRPLAASGACAFIASGEEHFIKAQCGSVPFWVSQILQNHKRIAHG